MTELPEHTFVADTAGVEAIGDALRAATWVALDTESNSMFVYRERVCLIQLNIDGQLWVVDTLAFPAAPATLAAWREPLGNPRLRLYLHGAEYDVAVLKRDYALTLANIFDTQQAASYLGFQKTGYGSLVSGLCDVDLPKEHTQYDWGTRPIDQAALRYALNDVIYLPQVARTLEAAAEAADLTEEIEIASEAIGSMSAHAAAFDPGKIWRLKGADKLNARELGILVALHAWRDRVAEALDEPPGRVIANAALPSMAQRQPQTLRDLKKTRLRGSILRAHGEDLIAVIKGALESPPEVPPRPARPRMSPAMRERGNRLSTWRRTEAERRQVPQVVVLPTAAVDYLLAHGASDLSAVPELGAKRVRLYGDQLRDLLA